MRDEKAAWALAILGAIGIVIVPVSQILLSSLALIVCICGLWWVLTCQNRKDKGEE
jgi:hypothetical protein